MIMGKIKEMMIKKGEEPNKKKIENLVVFLVILIVTIITINFIWNNDNENADKNKQQYDANKKLASEVQDITQEEEISSSENNMVEDLEEILSNINGVGKVKVMVTYSQTSQSVPLYNQDVSEKSTEESDSQGGNRKITETDNKKEIIYKEENGKKIPITQSVISPTIEGAIITAEGAGNSIVKTNIIQAVEAVTGVATHKIQVFEMNKNN